MENVLRDLSYGMYVISAKDGLKDIGCIANTVVQITSDPKTVIVSLNHDNYTNEIIKKTHKFGVSILTEETDKTIIGTFGYKSSRDVDKFEGITKKEIDGIPVIKDSNGAFTCEVIDTMETNTHTVFLGKVLNMEKFNNANVMTYKYYHEVLKGKSPKNAPTFEAQKEENSSKKTVWRCPLCGYEVELDELPEDFVCPICGASREHFEKIEK